MSGMLPARIRGAGEGWAASGRWAFNVQRTPRGRTMDESEAPFRGVGVMHIGQ